MSNELEGKVAARGAKAFVADSDADDSAAAGIAATPTRRSFMGSALSVAAGATAALGMIEWPCLQLIGAQRPQSVS
jgi:hypothetical protein